MTFSEKLKKLRKEKKVTQEQLAQIIGVERSSIGKYETGTQPSTDIMKRIADYFGVTVDYLLGREEITKDNRHTAPDYSDVKVALFGGDGEVTDEMWDEVKQFADYVKAKYLKEKK